MLQAARALDVPLVIGTAGSAGAGPHLDATLAMIRDIARTDGLRFRMAVMRADIPRPTLLEAVRSGKVTSFDGMPALTEEEVTEAAHIVGQMGMGPFRKALEPDVDVIVAGRACDTAIFASLPAVLGFPVGLAMHMAKIIECGSLCCVPGGRDPILAELDHDGFVLESMNPERRATPTSVAAHSLYEQSDPFTMQEPDGTLDLTHARYEAVDDRRTRVSGATWRDTTHPTIKLEGAAQDRRASGAAVRFGRSALHRAVQGAAAEGRRSGAEPGLRGAADGLHVAVPGLWHRRRAHGGAGERGAARRGLHHGRVHRANRANGRPKWCGPASSSCCISATPGGCPPPAMSRFPFTPPEVSLGPAYRFSVYHLLHVDDADALFPMEVETL